MSRSLAEAVGKHPRRKAPKHPTEWVLPTRLMGIEIEVEHSHSPVVPPLVAGWTSTGDGSLRLGTEFKLAEPLAGDYLGGAVTSMFQEAKFGRSFTSSTHIHIDMLDDVEEEVMQVIFLLAYMTEEVLFAVGDRGRKYCGFTNKLTTLQGSQIAALVLGKEEYDRRRNELCNNSAGSFSPSWADPYMNAITGTGSQRYVGLNSQALYRYGSLEFRYFPTATSQAELEGWINLVQSYLKASMELGTKRAIIDAMQTQAGYESILDTYFAPWKPMFLTEASYEVARMKLYTALTAAEVEVSAPFDLSHTSLANVSKRYKKKAADDEAGNYVLPEHALIMRAAEELRASMRGEAVTTDAGAAVTAAQADVSPTVPTGRLRRATRS